MYSTFASCDDSSVLSVSGMQHKHLQDFSSSEESLPIFDDDDDDTELDLTHGIETDV